MSRTSVKRKGNLTETPLTLHAFFAKTRVAANSKESDAVFRSSPKLRCRSNVPELILISDDDDDDCRAGEKRNPAVKRIRLTDDSKIKDELDVKFSNICSLRCPASSSATVSAKDEIADFRDAELLHTASNQVTDAIKLDDDEWGMGDDEKVEESDSDIEILECPPSTSKLEYTVSSVPPISSNANAFSTLMSSYAHNAAWAEATVDHAKGKSKLKSQQNSKRTRRHAPFYKILQGMPIAVDAFRYGAIPGVTSYFLTHAHSDHYTNLSSNWAHGPIYCSITTANLIKHMLGVAADWVHGIPFDVPTLVPDSGGVSVTLIDANHCPGSCLFLFEGPQTINAGDSQFKSPFLPSNIGLHEITKPTERIFRYLHCGDFRASPRHVSHVAIRGKKLDTVYLDTTYLNPKYTFPPQSLVISACADLASRLACDPDGAVGSGGKDGKERTIHGWVQTSKPKGISKETTATQASTVTLSTASTATLKNAKTNDTVLFVVGTYSIGKERIVKAIAKILNSAVYCDARKAAILRCQDDPVLASLLTTDPLAAMVHLVPLGVCSSDRLGDYAKRMGGHWKRVVGFRPTGWTYTPDAGATEITSIPALISLHQKANYTASSLIPMRNSTRALTLYGVPYSEHSSFVELACFALSCEWSKMIATVNVGTESGRNKIATWVKHWQIENNKRRERGEGAIESRTLDYW